HEASGTDVLLGRVIAERDTATSQLYSDLLFQKPLAAGRDIVDLVTTVGWAHNVSRTGSLGVEAIGEDLEGFWDAEESEGGARLLAGPTLRISPADDRWRLTATGGPIFHPSDSGRTSAALRDLPADTRRAGYAFRVSLSIAIVGAR